jgi:hypothetical protein
MFISEFSFVISFSGRFFAQAAIRCLTVASALTHMAQKNPGVHGPPL